MNEGPRRWSHLYKLGITCCSIVGPPQFGPAFLQDHWPNLFAVGWLTPLQLPNTIFVYTGKAIIDDYFLENSFEDKPGHVDPILVEFEWRENPEDTTVIFGKNGEGRKHVAVPNWTLSDVFRGDLVGYEAGLRLKFGQIFQLFPNHFRRSLHLLLGWERRVNPLVRFIFILLEKWGVLWFLYFLS